eukprot:jgi/Botrbrau1/11774/Bobra.0195s0099.1
MYRTPGQYLYVTTLLCSCLVMPSYGFSLLPTVRVILRCDRLDTFASILLRAAMLNVMSNCDSLFIQFDHSELPCQEGEAHGHTQDANTY